MGGLTRLELLEELVRAGVEINEAGKTLFACERFVTSAKRTSLRLLDLTVRNLGFPQGATTSELYKKALQLGLRLCPLEAGPHLRLQHLDQPEGYWGQPIWEHRAPPVTITVATETVSKDGDFPNGFYLRRIKGTLWLRGYCAGPDHIWDPQDHFVFSETCFPRSTDMRHHPLRRDGDSSPSGDSMNRPNRLWHRLLFIALSLAPFRANAADVQVGTSEELVEALRHAKAGTTILLNPGTYRGGLASANLQGTEEEPIVIAGADPARPPVIDGGSSGLHLSSPEHVELRDLVITRTTSNGINIDDSGSTSTPARAIVLINIAVRDVGPMGNRDGIKLSGVDHVRIENCEFERWGSEGSAIDMVGCRHAIVADCQFRDGGELASGVQTKGGCSEIVIQRCRFQNAGGRAVNLGGSTDLEFFRPANASFEAAAITVEDCDFIGGLTAIAFVGVDGALVQHNTIYRPERWPIRILQENTEPRFVACRHGQFINNVVAFRADEIRTIVNIGPDTEPASFTFAGNLWHCLDRPRETQRWIRLPVEETGGTYDQVPRFRDPSQRDIRITGNGPEDPGVRPDAR